MSVIFQSSFTFAGDSAREGFEADFFITFNEKEATEDIKEYCFLHNGCALTEKFDIGDLMVFGDKRFPITAFGNNAFENFRDLGHVTIYFDGAEQAKLPGTIHLLGKLPSEILQVGSRFSIVKG